MKIGVLGYGHFAGVVAHCLSEKGHQVIASDFAPPLFREDQRLPKDEPGWSLNYSITMDLVMSDADLFWVAYDVPLNAIGYPLTEEILARIQRLDRVVAKSIPFLVSCQWPVGTTAKCESLCPCRRFVYVMENVRAGKAIRDFQNPAATVIGQRHIPTLVDLQLTALFDVGDLILVSTESAEFAKHATNAFIALQIAFVNELARIAPPEVNMAQVTEALKSDGRVSPNAPLTAGSPFGGGSLKRDLMVLYELNPSAYTPIIGAIMPSNEWTPDAEEARAERKARKS